ncbi:MAG: hypothetical protein ABSF50_16425, partial [Burkholderiaceae bacterium]
PSCEARLEDVKAIEAEPRYLKVSGTLSPTLSNDPVAWRVTDDLGRIEGVVLSGRTRPERKASADYPLAVHGFKGYVRSAEQGQRLALIESGSGCRAVIDLPTVPGTASIPDRGP